MRIAIIQWLHPIQIHTVLVANYLARSGHIVHFFSIDLADDKFYSSVAFDERVVRHRFETNGNDVVFFLFKVVRKLAKVLSGKKKLGEDYGNKLRLKKNLAEILVFFRLTSETFDVSLGVEKEGLLCATLLQKTASVPYCYYSLELYLEDHTDFMSHSWSRILRSQEAEAHKNALATIIQDEQRALSLYTANGLSDNCPPVFYLPVSVDCNDFPGCSNSFQSLPVLYGKFEKQLLLFGVSRLSDREFVELSRRLPSDYCFVVHSRALKKEQNLIQEYGLDNVRLSSEVYDERGIHELIVSVNIGLCWYRTDNSNDRLTAFSSEKVARFMAQGKPIIACSNSNFDVLFEQCRCGETIRDISEIGDAILKIEANYQQYADAAYEAYQRFFSFEVNFSKFEPFLRNLLELQRLKKGKNES